MNKQIFYFLVFLLKFLSESKLCPEKGTCIDEKLNLSYEGCQTDCDCQGERTCQKITSYFSACMGYEKVCFYACDIEISWKSLEIKCPEEEKYWKGWIIKNEENENENFSSALDISPEENLMFVGSVKGRIFVYSLKNGDYLSELNTKTDNTVLYIKYIKEKNFLITTDFEGIKLWDLDLREKANFLNIMGRVVWADYIATSSFCIFKILQNDGTFSFGTWDIGKRKNSFFPEESYNISDLIGNNSIGYYNGVSNKLDNIVEVKFSKKGANKIFIKNLKEKNVFELTVFDYSVNPNQAINILGDSGQTLRSEIYSDFAINDITGDLWLYGNRKLAKANVEYFLSLEEIDITQLLSISSQGWISKGIFSKEGNFLYIEIDNSNTLITGTFFKILNLVTRKARDSPFKINNFLIEYECGDCPKPCGQRQLTNIEDLKCTNECPSGYLLETISRTCLPCQNGLFVINYFSEGVCLICKGPCKTCEVQADNCTSCFADYKYLKEFNICDRPFDMEDFKLKFEHCMYNEKACPLWKKIYVSSNDCFDCVDNICDGSSLNRPYKYLYDALLAISKNSELKANAEQINSFVILLLLEGEISASYNGNEPISRIFEDWSTINLIITSTDNNNRATLIFDSNKYYTLLQLNSGFLLLRNLNISEIINFEQEIDNKEWQTFLIAINNKIQTKIFFDDVSFQNDINVDYINMTVKPRRIFLLAKIDGESKAQITINLRNVFFQNFKFFTQLIKAIGSENEFYRITITINQSKIIGVGNYPDTQPYLQTSWFIELNYSAISMSYSQINEASSVLHVYKGCVCNLTKINVSLTTSYFYNYNQMLFLFNSSNIINFISVKFDDITLIPTNQIESELDWLFEKTFIQNVEFYLRVQCFIKFEFNNSINIQFLNLSTIQLQREYLGSFSFFFFGENNTILENMTLISFYKLNQVEQQILKNDFFFIYFFFKNNIIRALNHHLTNIYCNSLTISFSVIHYFYNNSVYYKNITIVDGEITAGSYAESSNFLRFSLNNTLYFEKFFIFREKIYALSMNKFGGGRFGGIPYDYLTQILPQTLSPIFFEDGNIVSVIDCQIKGLDILRTRVFGITVFNFKQSNFVVLRNFNVSDSNLGDTQPDGFIVMIFYFYKDNIAFLDSFLFLNDQTQALQTSCALITFFEKNFVKLSNFKFTDINLMFGSNSEDRVDYYKRLDDFENIINREFYNDIFQNKVLSITTNILSFYENMINLVNFTFQNNGCNTGCIIVGCYKNYIYAKNIYVSDLQTDYLLSGVGLLSGNFLFIDRIQIYNTSSIMPFFASKEYSTIIILNMEAENIKAESQFGGLFWVSKINILSLINIKINSVMTTTKGGVFGSDTGNSLFIRNCSFNKNLAILGGGGVFYINNENKLGIDNVFVNSSLSPYGGFMKINEQNEINIIRASFTRNIAIYDGALIFCMKNNKIIIDTSIFQINTGENVFRLEKNTKLDLFNIFINGEQFFGTFITYMVPNDFLENDRIEINIQNCYFFNFTQQSRLIYVGELLDGLNLIIEDSEISVYTGSLFKIQSNSFVTMKNLNFKILTLLSDFFISQQNRNHFIINNCSLSDVLIVSSQAGIIETGDSNYLELFLFNCKLFYFFVPNTIIMRIIGVNNTIKFNETILDGSFHLFDEKLKSLFIYENAFNISGICQVTKVLCSTKFINNEIFQKFIDSMIQNYSSTNEREFNTSTNKISNTSEEVEYIPSDENINKNKYVYKLISIENKNNSIACENLRVLIDSSTINSNQGYSLTQNNSFAFVFIFNKNNKNKIKIINSYLNSKNYHSFIYSKGNNSVFELSDSNFIGNTLNSSLIVLIGEGDIIKIAKTKFFNNIITSGIAMINLKNGNKVDMDKVFFSGNDSHFINNIFLRVVSFKNFSIKASHFIFSKTNHSINVQRNWEIFYFESIQELFFEKNFLSCAQINGDHSPMKITNTKALIKYSSFFFNENRAGAGGVIRFSGNQTLTCTYNNFIFNKAFAGGVFAIPDKESQLNIYTNIFFNNEAQDFSSKFGNYSSRVFSKYFSPDSLPRGSIFYLMNSIKSQTIMNNKFVERNKFSEPIQHAIHQTRPVDLSQNIYKNKSDASSSHQSSDISRIYFYLSKLEKNTTTYTLEFSKSVEHDNCTVFVFGFDGKNNIQTSLPYLKTLSYDLKNFGYEGNLLLTFALVKKYKKIDITCDYDADVINTYKPWNKLKYTLEIIYPEPQPDIIPEESVASYIFLKDLSIVLEDCNAGESLDNTTGVCEPCERGKFSNNYNLSGLSLCDQCVDTQPFYCLGANIKTPKPSYWQPYEYSDNFYKCPRMENCEGDYLFKASEDWNINKIRTYIQGIEGSYSDSFCKIGYKGTLCAECDGFRGIDNNFVCADCGDWKLFLSRAIMILIKFILVFLSIKKAMIVNIEMARKKGAITQVERNNIKGGYLLKIMLEHYQHIIFLSFLPLKIPDTWRNSISFVLSSASNDMKGIFSLECLLKVLGLDRFTNTWVLTIFLHFIFNLSMLLVVAKTISYMNRSSQTKKIDMNQSLSGVLKQKLTFIIKYIYLTNIVGQSEVFLKSYFCKSFGERGLNRLISDFSLDCHAISLMVIRWAISLPLLLFILFALPLRLFTTLWRNKNHLKTKEVLGKYAYFYIPFRKKRYFFEIILISKRIAFLWLQIYQDHVIVSNEGEGSFVNLVFIYFVYLFLFFISFNLLRPYKRKQFNELNVIEKFSLNVLMITCFSVILWWIAKESFFASMIIIVGGFNLFFFIWWIFSYFKVKKQRIIENLLSITKKIKAFRKTNIIEEPDANTDENLKENNDYSEMNRQQLSPPFTTKNLGALSEINSNLKGDFEERSHSDIFLDLFQLQNEYSYRPKPLESLNKIKEINQIPSEVTQLIINIVSIQPIFRGNGPAALKLRLSGNLKSVEFSPFQNNMVCLQENLGNENLIIWLKIIDPLEFNYEDLANLVLWYKERNIQILRKISLQIEPFEIINMDECKSETGREGEKAYFLHIPFLFRTLILFNTHIIDGNLKFTLKYNNEVNPECFSEKYLNFFCDLAKNIHTLKYRE